MSLYDIFCKLAQIENGLAYGEIMFSFDNMMSAFKPGHPVDILDDIFGNIGNELYFDPDADIDKDELEEVLHNLKEFKKAFKVKELRKPIKELELYLHPKTED